LNSKIKSWIIELRAPFLTGTLVSIFLGTAIAWTRNNVFNFGFFLLALLGGIFLHLGANVANDYFDHKSGNDEVNKEFIRPFSGGSRTIQLGLLSPREVLAGALLFYAAAILIGVYFALTVGIFIFAIGLFGVFSGFFYTAPSLNLAGSGLGEILVGINFGTLMTLGAYYVQTGILALEPILASAPISFLIAAILYINEFPDYTADKTVGKNNWVVRLGKAKAAYGYAVIVLGAYIAVLLSVALGVSPPQVLFALIPLPLAIAGIRHTFKFHSEASYKLAPANALTAAFHFMTSLLISCGYLLYKFEVMSLAYFSIVAIIGVCILLTINLYIKTKKPPPQ
jgi:1,4-dihydroxy-2-naphthoate octaprenyltransferase